MSRSDLLNAGKALGLALLPLGLGLQPAGAARALTQDENNVIRMFQRNKSSVVFITNLTLRRDAYTMNQMEIPQGAGSGIVWPSSSSSSSSSSSTSSPAADGTIVVTNYHVVRGDQPFRNDGIIRSESRIAVRFSRTQAAWATILIREA